MKIFTLLTPNTFTRNANVLHASFCSCQSEHFSKKSPRNCCFSVIGKDRSLDLEAPSREARDQ